MFGNKSYRLLAALVALLLWGSFTWPLTCHFTQAIPCSDRRTEGGAPVRELIPGDHLQLLYHFWLARDMLAGATPRFANVYEFNLGDDAARIHPDPYYLPFSLLYALVSSWWGDAMGWNVAGLCSWLLGFGMTLALARRYARDRWAALLATAVCAALPYRWITLLNGSPTGFAMGLAPMLLLGLDLAVRDRRIAGGWLAGAALLGAYCCDLHTFYFGMLATPAWCLLAWFAVPGSPRPTWRRLGTTARALLPCAALAFVALALSRLTSSRLAETDLAGGRSWAVVRLFSPTLRGLCTWRGLGMSNHLFLGCALSTWLGVGLLQHLRRREERDAAALPPDAAAPARARLLLLLLLAALMAIVALALGTNGPLHGLALRVCRKLLPKYTMIRQTVKIYCLLPTLLAVLGALLLPAARRWREGWNPLLLLLALLALTEFRLQLRAGLCALPTGAGAYTPVTAHAAQNGDPRPHAIALPLWPGESHWTSRYEYEITRSRVRLVNGYAPSVPAGYHTNVFQRFESMNQGALSVVQADALRAMGVRYVIFHEQPYPEQVSPFPSGLALRRLLGHPRLKIIGHDGPVWCFALLATARDLAGDAPLWGPARYPAGRHWPRPDTAALGASDTLDLRLRGAVAAAPERRYLLRVRGPGLLANSAGDVLVAESAWRWRELACHLDSGERLRVSGGAPQVSHALLTAGEPVQPGVDGACRWFAADLFHGGGSTDIADGSVLLNPDRDPQGLALAGPSLPLPPGRYRVILITQAVTTDPATEVGRLIPALSDGHRFGDYPVHLGQPAEAIFDTDGALPLRIEFHYHRHLPLRLLKLELTRLPPDDHK